LIDHLGADITVNYKNREGNSALHLAAQNGHLECVKLLVEKGANINLPGKNRATPLILASGLGHFPVVEYLLEEVTPPAKILLKDKFKRSALIMAVRNGNL
jgi:ankyrin repeat protein